MMKGVRMSSCQLCSFNALFGGNELAVTFLLKAGFNLSNIGSMSINR